MTGLCLTRRKKFATDAESEPKTGRVPCYVCGVLVSRKKGVDIGHNLFRHKRCRAGTKRWLAHSKGDPFRRYFTEEGIAMVNGIRPMRDNAEAIAFRGPELDDYLAVRAAKHRFGRAGCEIVKDGDHDVAADDAGSECAVTECRAAL